MLIFLPGLFFHNLLDNLFHLIGLEVPIATSLFQVRKKGSGKRSITPNHLLHRHLEHFKNETYEARKGSGMSTQMAGHYHDSDHQPRSSNKSQILLPSDCPNQELGIIEYEISRTYVMTHSTLASDPSLSCAQPQSDPLKSQTLSMNVPCIALGHMMWSYHTHLCTCMCSPAYMWPLEKDKGKPPGVHDPTPAHTPQGSYPWR